MYNFTIEVTDEYCNKVKPFFVSPVVSLCLQNFEGAFNPVFRMVKVYQIALSIISMLSITYFFTNYTNHLVFHFNIKILIFYQFISCFLQAAILGVAQTHHLVLALLATNPCDVVLPPFLFACFNIPLIFSMLCMEFSQVLMVIERTLATCLFVCYEKTTKTIGLVLTAVAVLLPALTCVYMYYDDQFNYPQMSAMATSPGSVVKVNYIFITVTVMNILTLVHTIGLYRHNQRKRNSVESHDRFILSSRFQINENVTSARLLWWLSSAQLVIFLTYGCTMYSLRIFLSGPRNGFWQAITELCYTPPIYCAVMPLLCIISAQSSSKERNSKIQSLVTLRSVGREGWENYESMLKQQWA